MDEAVSFGVMVGSPLLAVVSTVYLPRAVWDSDTGCYRGYFNKRAARVMLVVVVFFAYVAIRMEKPGPDAIAYVLAQLFLALGLSRLYVELSHKKKYGEWLHRLYHKMTE